MQKFILVFEQDGYPENDSGTHAEFFERLEAMDKRCNELLTEGRYGDPCRIICAGKMSKEYSYIPKEKITVFERINRDL